MQEGRQAVGEVRSGEHAATTEECAVLCAALPCCPDSLAATEAVGKLLVPATQAAACRFVEESGAGGRWSREHCGCRLRCSSVGNVWWWGVAMALGSAPERGDRTEGVPSSVVIH